MNICKMENTLKINNQNSHVVFKTKTINKFRQYILCTNMPTTGSW